MLCGLCGNNTKAVSCMASWYVPFMPGTKPDNLWGKLMMTYPHIYELLTLAGHEPANAATILLDAMCGDNRALTWIKLVFKSRHDLYWH